MDITTTTIKTFYTPYARRTDGTVVHKLDHGAPKDFPRFVWVHADGYWEGRNTKYLQSPSTGELIPVVASGTLDRVQSSNLKGYTDLMDDINRVMNRLPELDADDAKMIASIARGFLASGWSEDDVVRYLRCHEFVNPDLDEEVALARMARIRERYKK